MNFDDKEIKLDLGLDSVPSAPLSRAEASRQDALLRRAIARFKEIGAEFDRVMAPGRAASAAVDLVVSLSRRLAGGFQGIAEWAESLVPEFPVAASPAFAMRSAGAGSAPAAQSTRLAFEKAGEGCSLKVAVEPRGDNATVTLGLVAPGGAPLHPFTLTVTDMESGAVLLDGKRFAVGSAVLGGVQKGVYRVKAENSANVCGLTFRIE